MPRPQPSPSRAPRTRIRPYRPSDARALTALVAALADYEELPRPTPAAARRLIAAIGRRVHVLIAEVDGRPVGYAIFLLTFSSFVARPTLYLEDLFVLPEHRRGGIGRLFFDALRAAARREGCGRIDWVVLDWNRPAQRFYHELGARPLDDWITYRLELEGKAGRRASGSKARARAKP
jgi:GNAT superfamily N-acetyltransferase